MRSKSSPAEIIEQHQQAIIAWLRVLGCDRHGAEDLAQETFLLVLRKGMEERSEPETRAYLRAVARNLYLTRARKESRRDAILRADAAHDIWQRQVGEAAFQGYREALRDCLGLLAPKARDAIRLRYGEGMGGDDAAAALGVKSRALHTMVSRARAQLKECIEKKL